MKMYSRKLENQIMIFQSDNDIIAKSTTLQNWFRSNIRTQNSTAYKHSENGQIERDIQNVMDHARTIFASYNVPKSLWWDAIKRAVWLINRSPTSKQNNNYSTHIELVDKVKPNITEMIFFALEHIILLKKKETN